MSLTLFAACFGTALVACGGPAAAPDEGAEPLTSVDVGDFEVHLDGFDRFTVCPPIGALGEPWIPDIHEEGATARAAWREPGVTDKAIQDTLVPFRSCYRRGLLHDPTQSGHVAIVLRVDAKGNVEKAETYGACELSRETLTCMTDVGKAMKFDPPGGGRDTVILPVSYEPRSGRAVTMSTERSSYAAQVVRRLDAARPALHACERAELSAGRPLEGDGTYRLEIDGKGRVTKVNIDPWRGNQQLLGCGANALEKTMFAAPSSGRAVVFLRLAFDPRRITR